MKELEELNIEFKKFIQERCIFNEDSTKCHFPNFMNYILEKPLRSTSRKDLENIENCQKLLKKIIISKDQELKLKGLKIIIN